jgi:6,7-dimethyl-8-ribityllumazine synthase
MASFGKKKHTIAGTLKTDGACVIIVKTEWNAAIVNELETGCINELKKQGIKQIQSVLVPGAAELPHAIKACWEKLKYKDGKPMVFIALGTVIKGDTPHFDYVCKIVAEGIGQLNLMLPVPTIFGVLTVNNLKQAKERIGGKHGHKGVEAASAAIQMMQLNDQFIEISKKLN